MGKWRRDGGVASILSLKTYKHINVFITNVIEFSFKDLIKI